MVLGQIAKGTGYGDEHGADWLGPGPPGRARDARGGDADTGTQGLTHASSHGQGDLSTDGAMGDE
jgi:hypothetical protein